MSEFSLLITRFVLLMRLLVPHVADGFVVWWMESYRKSFIRSNREYQASQMPSSKERHVAREP